MEREQTGIENRWEPVPVDHPLAHLERLTIQMEWDAEAQSCVTYVPELNGISTFGQTREEALNNTRDMILAYLDSMEDLCLQMPIGKDDARKVREILR